MTTYKPSKILFEHLPVSIPVAALLMLITSVGSAQDYLSGTWEVTTTGGAYYKHRWEVRPSGQGGWLVRSTLLDTNQPAHKPQIGQSFDNITLETTGPGKFRYLAKGSSDLNPIAPEVWEQRGEGTYDQSRLSGKFTHTGSNKVSYEFAFEGVRVEDKPKPVLLVALAVDDKLRKAREDQWRRPIVETEKRMDAKQRELDELRKHHDKATADLGKTTADLQAATQKLTISSRGIAYFVPMELAEDVRVTKTLIEYWKKAIAEYDARHSGLPPFRDREEWAEQLKGLEEHLAEMNKDHPTLFVDVTHPQTGLAQEAKLYFEAAKATAELTKQRQEHLEAIRSLETEVGKTVTELEALRTELATHNGVLYAKATPSIEEVTVSINNDLVLRGVYSAQDAEQMEKLRDINERIAAEWLLFQHARNEKDIAKRAFFDEANATIAAGAKLSGWTGAIMVNAAINAATHVLEVASAMRKGGPYAALAEALEQASDFAIKYVSSGGEDVGYAGVDETQIEQRVAARLQGGPEPAEPSTVDELKKKALEYGKDKATGFIPDKIIKHAHKCSVQELLKNVPRGRNPVLEAERNRIRGYLQEINEPGTLDKLKKLNDSKEFKNMSKGLAKSVLSAAVKAGIKKAGRSYEEQAWTEYFEHDIRSRVLFEVYQHFHEIYDDEAERYAALLEAQQALLNQRPCDPDAFRIVLQNPFPEATVKRNVVVSVKTRDVDQAKLRVEVEQASAEFVRPDRFNGTLAPGVPKEKRVHVKVTAPQP